MNAIIKNWAAEWIAITTSTSRYAAVGLSFGGVAGLIAHFMQAQSWTWFLLGICIPVGPLYLYFSSSRAMRGELQTLQTWKEQHIITAKEYAELRSRAILWYGDRRFGVEPPLPGIPGEPTGQDPSGPEPAPSPTD